MYCLNYAGCKGAASCSRKNRCTAYCLNYAGCKGMKEKGYDKWQDCTALTMRDVKFKAFSTNLLPISCTALTMRDVKGQKTGQYSMYYTYCLNYAGCKG